MPHYVALIHKDPTSSYGVSFPDVPGVITAGDTLDDAMQQAAEVLTFAAEDWEEVTGTPFPPPRTLEELRHDHVFLEDAQDAMLAVVPMMTILRERAA